MRNRIIVVITVLLLAATSVYASYARIPIVPIRVGVVNALHDHWFEPNLTAATDLTNLGFHAIKMWPTEHHLSSDMLKIYRGTEWSSSEWLDVIVLRPLSNEPQPITETGCDGKQYQYFRWENIDYGQVADDLYNSVGDLNLTIILTGWEADNQIKGLGCSNRIPSQSEIDSFTAMLNARQAGVEAARANHPGAALLVLHAIEVNHVLGTSFRVIDSIIPNLQHPPDMVSYSHWSTTFSITDSLNHIQDVTGLWRDEIFIGEVGRTEYPHASQYPYIYDSLSEAFEWGAHLGFMWNYRDEFQCIQGKNYGRWLRDCDDNLATSYGALKDLQRDYE